MSSYWDDDGYVSIDAELDVSVHMPFTYDPDYGFEIDDDGCKYKQIDEYPYDEDMIMMNNRMQLSDIAYPEDDAFDFLANKLDEYEDMLEEPGKYAVDAEITLVYEVENIFAEVTGNPEMDRYDGSTYMDIGTEYFLDDADSTFLDDKSKIQKLSVSEEI